MALRGTDVQELVGKVHPLIVKSFHQLLEDAATTRQRMSQLEELMNRCTDIIGTMMQVNDQMMNYMSEAGINVGDMKVKELESVVNSEDMKADDRRT